MEQPRQPDPVQADRPPVELSVFTKPWPALPADRLAAKVRAFGFDGIELPVRDGFQVEPSRVAQALPAVSRAFEREGLRIFSVAGPTEEPVFAACAEAGIPVLRIMLDVDFQRGYWASERSILAELEKLQPLCDRYGVKVGIQQHVGRTRVKTAAGLLRFLERLDPKSFGAIWDAGHDGLRGEGPEIALDMLESHLCMVNLKNAHYVRVEGSGGDDRQAAQWRLRFTTGRDGMASWPEVVQALQKRRYHGVVCLTAEYDDEAHVDRNIAEDLAYAKGLFGL